jgi:hypothetical protein
MQFELRVVPDCPHRRPAVALFRDVLDAAGLADAGFEIVIIDNAAAAAALDFTGSATLAIDGVDVFL